MRRPVFWDFRRAFIGLPALLPMAAQMIFPVVAIAGSYYLLEYHFTSNAYFDQYDGDVAEHRVGEEVFHHKKT